MKKKLIFASVALLLVTLPVYAVFNEKNLAQTLSVLRYELHQDYEKAQQERAQKWRERRKEMQHGTMVKMIKKCNELSLILYSQNQDYTFDVTYALKEVTQQYEDFNRQRTPYDDNVKELDLRIDQYERLLESLRRLPPEIATVGGIPDSLRMTGMPGMGGGYPRMAGRRTPRKPEEERKDAEGSVKAEAGSDSLATASDSLPKTGNEVLSGFLEGLGIAAKASAEEDSISRRSFMLDEQGQADRDSCIFYAEAMLSMYRTERERTIIDSTHYTDMSERLKQTYDYAKSRYEDLQHRIFIDGQDNYLHVLGNLKSYASKAFSEARNKYGVGDNAIDRAGLRKSDWRGPVVVGFIFVVLFYIALATLLSNIVMRILRRKMARLNTPEFIERKKTVDLLCGVIIFALTLMIASFLVKQNFIAVASRLLLVYAWLLAAILASLLIRSESGQVNNGVKLYIPLMLLGLIVIFFRIIFIPNRLVNLVLPPLLLVFCIWQGSLCFKMQKKVDRQDMFYAWTTLAVMAVTTVMACLGYVLMSIQVFIWWLFQVSAIGTITALKEVLRMYESKVIARRKMQYRKEHTMVSDAKKGSFIEVTWLFDFFKTTAIPILAVLSVPFSLWMASDVFDLSEICKTLFYKPFFDLHDTSGNQILYTSFYKIVLVASLYFLFRYACYLTKAFYRRTKLEHLMRESGRDYVHSNEVNLTLANNVIAIIIWGIYIAAAIIILKIPMGALSIVAAGLATGLGLALKDVLNNFIYGIQLMSGRLRVGDYVECDGVRGKVTSISYQSTQILTIDDAVMAFTNTTLFNKNFVNLTKNSFYRFVKIPIGVNYGADVDNIRKILTEAFQSLITKDKYDRYIVDPARGISVAFSNFGDSSIELTVKQYVLVEEEYAYVARAKELIYNTLNANGIEIPFPQRDVHIRN